VRTHADLRALAERLRRSSAAAAAAPRETHDPKADPWSQGYQRGRADGLESAAELVEALLARLEREAGEDAGAEVRP